MAKIVPIEIIASMSGKVCTHSDMYFSVNKQTGVIHTGKLCNPSTAEPTAKQLEVRQKFAERRQVTAAWMTANKPTTAQPEGTELYQQVLAAYKSQHQIGSLFGYVASLVQDGKVVFGSTTASSGSTSTSGTSTGGTSTGGTSTGGSSSTGGSTTTGGSGSDLS